jgi:hypothetical protein
VDVVSQVFDRVAAQQPAPQGWIIALAAVVAALLVWAPGAWPVTRHLVTIAHEGAHGVAALVSGRRLAGIRLHSDTSGLTVSSGKPHGFGMIVTAAAGYIGPAVFGLAAAAVLAAGHAVGLLWGLVALLALLLVQIRNWWGLLSVLVTGFGVFAVSWFAAPQWQSAFAYLVTWFLLLAAPRPVVELQRLRRRGRAAHSDADQLARLTGLPALLWVATFFAVTLGSLAAGAWLMLRPAWPALTT